MKIILPTPEQMEKIAKSWEPYRSVACWYMWQSLTSRPSGEPGVQIVLRWPDRRSADYAVNDRPEWPDRKFAFWSRSLV